MLRGIFTACKCIEFLRYTFKAFFADNNENKIFLEKKYFQVGGVCRVNNKKKQQKK